LKNDVNVPSKSIRRKTDPHRNVMDPEHYIGFCVR
jgi:hypothetical protein